MSEPEEPEPYALTEEHVGALERAIRAEGYIILVDSETGKVKLKRIETCEDLPVSASS